MLRHKQYPGSPLNSENDFVCSPAPDRHAARTVAGHPEQGWALLCNGVVLFDDGGELLPAG
ncbi:MAG TPA: DUF5999 family protein [Streptosporangiaceae bacterium]